jgi:hypothetical protein
MLRGGMTRPQLADAIFKKLGAMPEGAHIVSWADSSSFHRVMENLFSLGLIDYENTGRVEHGVTRSLQSWRLTEYGRRQLRLFLT